MRRCIALLLALLLATPAFARIPIEEWMLDPTTGLSVRRTGTSDGFANVNATVSAAATATVFYNAHKYTQAINQRLVVGNRDSSAALNMVGAKNIVAFVTITPDSATCSSVWSFQWRRHLDSFVDSLSTWPPLQPGLIEGHVAAALDFIYSGAADTAGTERPQLPLSALSVWSRERIYALPNNLQDPRLTFSFELKEGDGPFVGPFVSFRARALEINGTTACSVRALASCTIRVDLVGLP